MDNISAERRSENMRRIKSKDTSPERKIRSLLHSWGYRYRLHRRDLPGCPDIVFFKQSKAVFVHGCFWHMHSRCTAGRFPRSRLEYWKPKLLRNKRRDAGNLSKLRRMGWSVFVIWECELEKPAALTKRLRAFMDR
jgi:DNA mismatch endonuclease (patch repair protein)